MVQIDDSIVAIAAPATPAARGVIRISGPDTIQILNRLGIATADAKQAQRYAASIDLGPPLAAIPVDLLLWPTNRSYSGQPSAELHTYGSLPILQALVERAIGAGARAARPGEFTMRAFLAGRLDLTQAEAVLGVIDAEAAGSLDHALRQLAGNLSRPLQRLRAELLDLLADVEAGLDFVDEDIEFIDDDQLVDRLNIVHGQLLETARTMRSRGGGRELPTIVLCGHPNAGKSSLLNQLAGHDAAIVTEIAGTTRDSVAIQVDIDGRPVQLVDTAGIEPAQSEIAVMSQRQAAGAAAGATVRLWCVDHSDADAQSAAVDLNRRAQLHRTAATIDLWIATKADLPRATDALDGWIHCSATSGAGLDQVRRAIADQLESRDAEEVGSVIGTAARCTQSIQQACRAIAAAIDLTRSQAGHEFVAAELRWCVGAIGEVTGAIYTDDILDRVFSRFCIGK